MKQTVTALKGLNGAIYFQLLLKFLYDIRRILGTDPTRYNRSPKHRMFDLR
jgi:hypothetical protein